MVAKPASEHQEKKSRSEADRIKPNSKSGSTSSASSSSAEHGATGQRNPIYAGQNPSGLNANISDTFEGFDNKNNAGMQNLEASENFGSRFQMPDSSTSDNFLSAPDMTSPSASGSVSSSASSSASSASGSQVQALGQSQGLSELQETVAQIQDLVMRIRANLESSEQEELEDLLRQGAEILSGSWSKIRGLAGEQVSTVKSTVTENPYAGIVAALKIGMAISHLYTSRHNPSARYSSSSASSNADLSTSRAANDDMI